MHVFAGAHNGERGTTVGRRSLPPSSCLVAKSARTIIRRIILGYAAVLEKSLAQIDDIVFARGDFFILASQPRKNPQASVHDLCLLQG